MTRAEEYRLSQYQHLGALREDKSIDLPSTTPMR